MAKWPSQENPLSNPRVSKKERGLIKGALRRVFSRSDLRREALARHSIQHSDPNRPRVTKWAWCGDCGIIEAQYLMELDHIEPVIAVHETLEDLDANTLIDRIWCEVNNLVPKCKPCHHEKTRQENKERRAFKKGRVK